MRRRRPPRIPTNGGYPHTARLDKQTRANRAQEQHPRNRGFFMNCLNHPEVSAVAFCRSCGKPLCEECKRAAHGTVYCDEHVPAETASAGRPATTAAAPVRSDERRVGKECRSRWSPCILK